MPPKLLTNLARTVVAAADAATRVHSGSLSREKAFLSNEHPVHSAWLGHWQRLERAMKGGVHVLPLLRRFDWEKETGESIAQREGWATYVNFPDLYLGAITGLITPKLPKPGQGLSFGGLGEVSLEREKRRYTETQADLCYYNCDGIGNDGAQWDAWWMRRAKRAAALGHVWIMEEAAPPILGRERTFQDEINGARPYLVEFGPDRVWDWYFENGKLQYAIVRLNHRRPRITTNGAFTAENETHYYLLTARGWDGFGAEYSRGGYWRFNSEGNLHNNVTGNWDSLDGEIPFHLLYGERDEEGGSVTLPAISRPGIMELASIAVSYMNLASAADFEAWDSAKGMEYFIGAHQDAFNLAMVKIGEGSRYIPVPTSEGAQDPRVQSSNMGTVPAEVFDTRFKSKLDEVQLYGMLNEASTPDASGLSKAVGFAEAKAPKLASLASEIETAQNTSIRNLELRWGVTQPQGFTKLPREFDLMDVSTSIREAFTLSVEAGIESPTFKSQAFRTFLSQEGVFEDVQTLDAIQAEISAQVKREAEAAASNPDLADRVGEFAAPPAPRKRKFTVADGNGKPLRTITQNDED